MARFEGHNGPVYDLAFSLDGSQFISGEQKARVLRWVIPDDIDEQAKDPNLYIHTHQIHNISTMQTSSYTPSYLYYIIYIFKYYLHPTVENDNCRTCGGVWQQVFSGQRLDS